jgi:hypothetical protein
VNLTCDVVDSIGFVIIFLPLEGTTQLIKRYYFSEKATPLVIERCIDWDKDNNKVTPLTQSWGLHPQRFERHKLPVEALTGK